MLTTLPPRTKVSIRVFSHVTDPEDRTQIGRAGWLARRPFTEKIFPLKDREEKADEFKLREGEVFQRLERLYPYHLTPLVDALEEALADPDDFPADGSPQTLLVLTDGANTVLDGREVNPVARDTIDQVRDRVRRFRGKVRSNVAAHMLFFISDTAMAEKGEADAAWAMFADLEDPSAQLTAGKRWRANDAGELRRRLEKVFRPRARLLHKGGRPAEAVPAFGMPVNRDNDKPGELWWYGPKKIDTAADAYDLEFARVGAELRVAAGDRMVIRLGTDPDRRTTFTRDVYYRDVDRLTRANRATDEHPDWFLSVPGYNYERRGGNYLQVTAALEAKGRRTAGDDGVLRQPRPRFLWWELARLVGTAEQASDRTVYVRNVVRGQLPAPAWRVLADYGPNSTRQAERNRLRAFVLTDRDPEPLITFDVAGPARLEGAPLSIPSKAEPVTGTVGLESIAFYPDPEFDPLGTQPAGTKNLCLVVRAADAKGRILQARVRGLGPVTTREHRYFYRRDGDGPVGPRPPVAGYTAVFGPLTRESVAGLTDLQIDLVCVSDVLTDPRTAQIQLDLDSPGVGQRSPQVIEPGLTADLGLR